jgi:hypothetical protein
MLVVAIDLNGGTFDLDADVATAIVTSVIIKIEASGMLADRRERRHAWLGQCARASVSAGDADPLLLTPGSRTAFLPQALVRDLNVLADHVVSLDGAGILLRHDDVDALDEESRSVLEALVSHARDGHNWSVVLAAAAISNVGLEGQLVAELSPLKPREIFGMASEAARDADLPLSASVISGDTARAAAEATQGAPAETAFCLDRMWHESATADPRRLRLSRSLLRDLLASRASPASGDTARLLDRIDALELSDLFGLHFLAAYQAMSEDQVTRLMDLQSAWHGVEDNDVPEQQRRIKLPSVERLVEQMTSRGFLERHEGRFTVLGDPFARQYLRCAGSEHRLPYLPARGPTYTMSRRRISSPR